MMIVENADLHRMQRTFRSVLDAFAHPGTVQSIEPAPDNPLRPAALDAALESAVRLFVDHAVTFGVADGESDALAAYVSGETHSSRASVPDAEYVVVPARADACTAHRAVAEACRGTLIAPEKGATLLMGCTQLAEAGSGSCEGKGDGPAMFAMEVRGPGVRDVNRFAVDRIEWARARAARNDEFPCGIEILLVDADGRIVAIPRSSQVACANDGAGSANAMAGPGAPAKPAEHEEVPRDAAALAGEVR